MSNRIPRLANDPVPLAADSWLAPYREALRSRAERFETAAKKLTGGTRSLADFASGHEYYGLHFRDGEWIFREWAPNATRLTLVGDFCGWEQLPEFRLKKLKNGDWELRLPGEKLAHGMHYLLHVEWPGGEGKRIPAYARYVVQDPDSKLFSARIWHPAEPYSFRHPIPPAPVAPLIYEAHIGMAQEEAKVGGFREFREKILPRVARGGYNTLQLMAVMSHPYYGSFGYHVANFFSISSRFGTPDEFRELVDAAHAEGLRVIIDLVHSHAVKNEAEGLAKFDGTRHAYFHEGERGEHPGWDSLLFDYSKPQVLHFLLSNCRFWLDEYQLDGFRFDGVTSMLYRHHGLGKSFNGYGEYFSSDIDEDAVTCLALANRVIHELRPDALTVAEDVSGMPGLASRDPEGGIGFDCRMAMGVTDMWFKLFDLPDESWNMFYLYNELTNRRTDERSISYVECHDQAIVGGRTAFFRMTGSALYDSMHEEARHLAIDRAVAIHKLIRLATLATAGHGYLNFMGNEFGHPEWIDFPREGNNWSMHHARRQWSLADNPDLKFHYLADFDRALLHTVGGQPDFYRTRVQTLRIDDQCKLIAFERDGMLFFLNFHPSQAYTDHTFEVPAGEYETRLDTDAAEFGGFALRKPGQRYFTRPTRQGATLSLYLPPRTGLVLRKI